MLQNAFKNYEKTIMRPVIGLTLDSEDQGGGYSLMPWYALRQNYCHAVHQAGGLPLLLPHYPEDAAHYADRLDGLIVTGGDFDLDPRLYGESTIHERVTIKHTRTQFEWALVEAMLHQNKPILGICGGQQLLAVILGATLIQHIPDAVPTALAHEQPNPRTEAGHMVTVAPDSLLFRIVQKQTLHVNSAHHQAVRAVPETLTVNAVAPDGIIEGIEDSRYRFCLGVQWHPEYHVDSADGRLFDALIQAAKL
ncbi:MAG: gamma-glutamyl-gamma-aminobutyrate hydrolase family protein [Alphaproteobacteria bacterium]